MSNSDRSPPGSLTLVKKPATQTPKSSLEPEPPKIVAPDVSVKAPFFRRPKHRARPPPRWAAYSSTRTRVSSSRSVQNREAEELVGLASQRSKTCPGTSSPQKRIERYLHSRLSRRPRRSDWRLVVGGGLYAVPNPAVKPVSASAHGIFTYVRDHRHVAVKPRPLLEGLHMNRSFSVDRVRDRPHGDRAERGLHRDPGDLSFQ